MEGKFQKIKEIVERELSCSAHEMEHVMRVYNLCLHLTKYEPGIDLDILKTAALLHDIARVKSSKTKLATLTTRFSGLKCPPKFSEPLVILRKK